jgi:hypothetical protein
MLGNPNFDIVPRLAVTSGGMAGQSHLKWIAPMGEIDVSALKEAFEAASRYVEYSTVAVTIGVFVELVALFIFSKEMPPLEKRVLVIATALIVVGCAGEFIFGSRANDAASRLQQASEQKIAGLVKDTAKLSADAESSRASIASANEAAAKAGERAAEAAAEVAKANENAAIARKQAVELEHALETERIARSPRSISSEQKADLVAALIPVPKGKLFVIGSFFDAESTQFANQIIEVFKAAGFEVSEMPKERPNRPIGYTQPGAWLWVHDTKATPPHAGPIQQIFNAAGMYFDGQSHPDLIEPDEVLIAVSSHP